MSFTAQEAWQILKGTDGYIFTQEWYEFPQFDMTDISEPDWDVILDIKDIVNKKMDVARSEGLINSNLSASVTIKTIGYVYKTLSKLDKELKFVFINSNVNLISESTGKAQEVKKLDKESGQLDVTTYNDLDIIVEPAQGEKCVRCWHIREDIGINPAHPEICGRCVENVEGQGEVRHYA